MQKERRLYVWRIGGLALVLALASGAVLVKAGQDPSTSLGAGASMPAGAEWSYWGGDAASTRYSPLDQINASNVGKLEVIWRWRAANFGPEPDMIYRATPLYVNGKLYTVAGIRRTVVCIEPATGETLWTWRENTDGDPRWEASTRKNYGKGVAFARVDGRPTLYYLGAGFTMWALDANTGLPVDAFGKGEHPGHHPRVRREDRQTALALRSGAEGRRGLQRDVGERLVEVHGQRVALGAAVR